MTSRRPYALLCFALMTVLGSGCDLATKSWAEQTLGPPQGSTMILSSWLELALTYNRGTAFSLVGDLGMARWILGLLAIGMAAGLLVMAARRNVLEALSLGAIAAGALGNAFDRVFRLAPGGGTGVVDFIKVNYPWGGSWPIFNVADVLVAAGAIGVMLAWLPALRRPVPDAGTT